MRKTINTLFVILAMASVTYGMVLRYGPAPEAISAAPEIIPTQSVALPHADMVEPQQEDTDLDFMSEPD